MKQTFKTLALITLIGGSLTACNSDDATPTTPMDEVSMDTQETPNPSITGKASVYGKGVIDGSAEIKATLVDVSLINQAKYINGAENINADIKFEADIKVETADGFVNVQLEDTGTVRLTASKSTNSAEKEYEFNETIVQGGVTYEVTGTLDVEQGTLRSDIAVVEGKYADFYITNEGSGDDTGLTSAETETRNDFINNYKLKGNRTANLDTFTDHVVDAHNQGWTGSGLTVIVDKDSLESTEIIAPHADTITWDEYANSAAVLQNDPRRSDEIVTVGSDNSEYAYDLNNYYVDRASNAGQSEESALVAGGVALVWNKFDTLNDQQMVDLVEDTSRGNKFVLANTLSPVGNLK